MKVIKGIFYNPNLEGSTPVELDFECENYKNYYELLDCSTFDIQSRKIGGKYFDIYCDDEGKFKENATAIVTLDNHNNAIEEIVGSVFICQSNDEGETVSITSEDAKLILKHVFDLENENKIILANI